MKVAVVIPYFQRQQGVLRRSLRSVMAQSLAPDVVVIVDDQSPVPAEGELAELPDAWRARVKKISRQNGGPGAARNTGIDSVSGEATYIAFLDSDDEWSADHLENAIAALGREQDVYFSNYMDIDDSIDGFTRRGVTSLSDHPCIGGVDYLRLFPTKMFDQILNANLMQLSTTVYRLAVAPTVRFRTEYRRAGEDMLFFLDLASRTNRYCYSNQVEVTYGRGVNVYRSAVAGDPAAFDRIRDEVRFRRAVLNGFTLDAAQRVTARRSLARVRKDFAAEVLHRLRRRPAGVFRCCLRQFTEDPASALLLAPNLVACVWGWLQLRVSKGGAQ